MSKPLRSRRIPPLALLAGLLPLCLGCGLVPAPTALPSPLPSPPAVDATATPPATLNLSVWHSWDADQEQVFRDVLAAYAAQNPGVSISLQHIPVESIVSEYEEAVLEGAGPDLLAGRSDWIGRLAGRRVIVPLGDMLAAEYWGGFYPFALAGIETEGYRYAVPYACETVALYFNRAYVGEPPTTTARLLELAATWTAPEQGGLAFPLSFYNTVGYLYAFGGRLLDDEGQAALDSLEMRAWLAWLQQVHESPGVVAADSYGEADALFKSGSVAMLVNGSWALSDYLHALGSDLLGVAPLPMLDQTQSWPTPYVGYQVLMANPVRLVEHPQAVLDLLAFLGGPDAQQLLAARLNAIPTWSAIDLSAAPLLAGFVRQAELGRPRPVSSREQLLWDPLDSLLYNVTGGRVPLDVALQETQGQVEQLLQEVDQGAP